MMGAPPTTIEDAIVHIYGAFYLEDVPPDIKHWARDKLAANQEKIDLVRQGEEGYEVFLLQRLEREHDRARADGEDRRDAPLCTCNDLGCELKHGRLPRRIQRAETLDHGIRQFKQDHSGTPLVLDHDPEDASGKYADAPPGGKQQFATMKAEVWSLIRTLETYVNGPHSEPPTDSEAGLTAEPAD